MSAGSIIDKKFDRTITVGSHRDQFEEDEYHVVEPVFKNVSIRESKISRADGNK